MRLLPAVAKLPALDPSAELEAIVAELVSRAQEDWDPALRDDERR
jgi:hypothetical protein